MYISIIKKIGLCTECTIEGYNDVKAVPKLFGGFYYKSRYVLESVKIKGDFGVRRIPISDFDLISNKIILLKS